MKKTILFIATFSIINVLQAQFKMSVSKSELKRVSFNTDTLDNGNTYHHYFMLDDIKIGPSVKFSSENIQFFQYDKKGELQGSFIKASVANIEIGSYKNGQKHGNSFTTKNVSDVTKVIDYKKGIEYKDFTREYQENTNPIVSDAGKCTANNFCNWSDGKVQTIGWWDSPNVLSPALEIYMEYKNVYMGDFKKGERNGFGVYMFETGNFDVGYYRKGEDHGLGFTINPQGKVLFAANYDKGYYTKTFVDTYED